MTIDRFKTYTSDANQFPRRATTIIPSDTTDLPEVTVFLYVVSDGSLSVLPVDNADGEVMHFDDVKANTWILIQARRVLSTGTTAGVLGCWA